jgi:hypothetical protein
MTLGAMPADVAPDSEVAAPAVESTRAPGRDGGIASRAIAIGTQTGRPELG